ncbi:phosphoribosylamine--glycine ligase [Micromonospora sp. DT4]|uniref:phosphoribosylamine--glycine ligase n=1 Tax=Micromonospora sp. DT4 TaxID=3393438 RepID=UPI003CF71C94
MKVLLIDNSGRGHATADLMVRTNPDAVVYYAPGCDAITTERVISRQDLTLGAVAPMVDFARQEKVDLVLVSCTSALAAGFADEFRLAGLPTIGPGKTAARLETSKVYTKHLCERYGIPVADFACFDDPHSAYDYVKSRSRPVVIKADGLCGGNGTFVCDDLEAASVAIDTLMVRRAFGASGDRVVVEDKLLGHELLFFAMVSDGQWQLLPMAVDYPWSDDGDTGVLCGGVGAYSPHPFDTPSIRELFRRQILAPLLDAIDSEGLEYTGILYVGCMLVDGDLYLLEVNVRMGDPEAEVALPQIRSDFLATCWAMHEGRLDQSPPMELDGLWYCDVIATQGPTRQVSKGRNKGWYKGWPYGRYGRYYPISGIEDVDTDACRVYVGQATVHPEKGLVTDGGACINVVGFGATKEIAATNAYANIGKVSFEGMRYRTDIGR